MTYKESRKKERKKGRKEGGCGGGESLGIKLATAEVGPSLTLFHTLWEPFLSRHLPLPKCYSLLQLGVTVASVSLLTLRFFNEVK